MDQQNVPPNPYLLPFETFTKDHDAAKTAKEKLEAALRQTGLFPFVDEVILKTVGMTWLFEAEGIEPKPVIPRNYFKLLEVAWSNGKSVKLLLQEVHKLMTSDDNVNRRLIAGVSGFLLAKEKSPEQSAIKTLREIAAQPYH